MNILKKLDIIFTMHNDPYSRLVDDFIRQVIAEGKIVGQDYCYVAVELRGETYGIWKANRYYGDLSIVVNLKSDSRIYENKRPSRATQIAFWEWLERHDIFVDDSKDNDTENLKRILGESCPKK